MATNPRLRAMQQQIQQQGLTRDQAKGKYNLTDQDADWMNNNLGLRFSPAGAKPAGLMSAGAQRADGRMPPAPPPGGSTAGTGPIKADMGIQPATGGVISPVTQDMVAANARSAPPPPPPAAPTPPIITSPPPPPPSSTPVPEADTATATTAVATDARAATQGRTANATAAEAEAERQGRTANATAAEAEAERQGRVTNWRVGRNATVQGQIAGLIDSGSPLMEQAATRGLQAANSRGMANSSMGVQSAQAALYDAAMPIATQDANTFASAGQFNANERNDRDALNAQLGTQVNLTNANNATDVSKLNASESNDRGALNAQLGTQVAINNANNAADISKTNAALQADISKFNASESNALTKLGMDNDTRRDLANIEASYKTLMQTSASAGEIYKQYMGAVATILQSKDMDAVAKQEAINGLMGALNSSLDVVGGIGNLDIPDLEFQEMATIGQAVNGFPLPNAISGYGTINWNADLKDTDKSLRDMYNEYATENPDTALSPEAWYIKFRLKINDATGGTGGGTGNTGGSGTGSPDSGDSGP